MFLLSRYGLGRRGQEEVIGVVVDYFVADHRLYLGAGQHTKWGDFCLDELKDIRILPMSAVGLVVVDA